LHKFQKAQVLQALQVLLLLPSVGAAGDVTSSEAV